MRAANDVEIDDCGCFQRGSTHDAAGMQVVFEVDAALPIFDWKDVYRTLSGSFGYWPNSFILIALAS